ncbi:TetR/AcrR family transcriptional regulator [Nocardia pneumoniae]|uniref:TetR/AcrR family transcriptional regulator n=1 Tax=Nocardia pneumoniae TaxID=228601 RepID=UPI001C3F1881|nr:TetR/AcrR family transcriptional regulator [Nocardia pneumoniae]
MPKPKQGVGRPRNSEVDLALVRATRELLAERGYAGLTVDAVAARAGIGKAAIYRRYATKQEMIFSVVVHDMREQPPPDAGSLRADLAAVARVIAAQLGRAPTDVLAGLLADIYADDALATRFAETFLERERLVLTEVLNRAVTRGELPSLPDPTTVQALLLGPIFAWLLILDGDRDKLPTLTHSVAEATASALLSETSG